MSLKKRVNKNTRRGNYIRYSNKITMEELINAESAIGRMVFGPIPGWPLGHAGDEGPHLREDGGVSGWFSSGGPRVRFLTRCDGEVSEPLVVRRGFPPPSRTRVTSKGTRGCGQANSLR